MTVEVDKKTGLPYLIKRPSPESRIYSVDFKKLVTSIASLVSITVQPRNLVTEVDPLVIDDTGTTGTLVTFRAHGGTDQEDYEIKVVITDADGNTISDDVMLKVRIAGLIA